MKWHCAVGEAGGGAGDAGEEMQCWVGERRRGTDPTHGVS